MRPTRRNNMKRKRESDFIKFNRDHVVPSENGETYYIVECEKTIGYFIQLELCDFGPDGNTWRCKDCSDIERKRSRGRPRNIPVVIEKDGVFLSDPEDINHFCGWPSLDDHDFVDLETAKEIILVKDNDFDDFTQSSSRIAKAIFVPEKGYRPSSSTEVVEEKKNEDDINMSAMRPLRDYEYFMVPCVVCQHRRHRSYLAVFTHNVHRRKRWIKIFGGEQFRKRLESTAPSKQMLCRSHLKKWDCSKNKFGKRNNHVIPFVPLKMRIHNAKYQYISEEHDYFFHDERYRIQLQEKVDDNAIANVHTVHVMEREKSPNEDDEQERCQTQKSRTGKIIAKKHCRRSFTNKPFASGMWQTVETVYLFGLLRVCPVCASTCRIMPYYNKTSDVLFVDRECPNNHEIRTWSSVEGHMGEVSDDEDNKLDEQTDANKGSLYETVKMFAPNEVKTEEQEF